MSELVDLGHGRGLAAPAIAAAVWYLDSCRTAPLPISSAWRDPAWGRAAYLYWFDGAPMPPGMDPPTYAPAYPGTSPHETGDAFDTPDWAFVLAHPESGLWRPLGSADPVHFILDPARATFPREDNDMTTRSEVAELVAAPYNITGWFQRYLNRDPSPIDIGYFVSMVATSGAAAVEDAIGRSTEALTPQGNETLEQAIERFYRTVLGKEPDAAGVSYWTGLAKAAGLDDVYKQIKKKAGGK